MSESFWESEAAVETEPEEELPPAPEAEEGAEQPGVEARALTVSADDFSALEERIVRAVGLVKQERQARAAAEERAAQAEVQLREQKPRIERMEAELAGLRDEREQVRRRVDLLLKQLDALEL